MENALPDTVVQFLTPDTDPYDKVLVGGAQSRRPERPIPVRQWASLGKAERVADGVDSTASMAGSNQWVVGGAKTRDGRAILANDMHLSLGIPNIWYRAALHYDGRELNGVTLPGLPLLIVGSNGLVAWGFTNTDADVADLVRLEINPANPQEYKTPEGWRNFEQRREKFLVKGGEEVVVEMKDTVWGPVADYPLMGQPVALHWTALQTSGVDLGLLDIDQAQTLEQAMAVMNRSGGPTQNVVIADGQGHIGWTLLGRYPLRQGFDGSVSKSWADGNISWNGYIAPDELPRLIDPPAGFIATANNRTVGSDYPFILAHNQANGYRAYRIAQCLSEQEKFAEQDLLNIQLDTRSEFFDFYRALALDVLNGQSPLTSELEEARRAIEAWNGHMDADSLGIGLLWLWREKLAAVAFAPVVARCRQVDPDFSYAWRKLETPLRALLTQQIPSTLPNAQYRDWRDLLLDTLADSARELKRRQGVATLDGMTWGGINQVPIRHPFSKTMPFLSPLLDMKETELSGCAGFCVRIAGNGHGATERMVASPNHPEQGILHMPGGQSGHPLSAHYRDQQPAWQEGVALPFRPGETKHTLSFIPAH
jgi:penicillin amidase